MRRLYIFCLFWGIRPPELKSAYSYFMGIELVLLLVALAFVGITRGSYKSLFKTKINHAWALFPVLVGHLVIEFAPIKEKQFDSVGIAILLGTYVFLIGFLCANLNLKGMWIALLGVCSNALVIALNLGMPVTNSGDYTVIESIKHQPSSSTDILGFLGDQLPINFLSIAVSIGDIVFALGLITVCFFASRKSNTNDIDTTEEQIAIITQSSPVDTQIVLDITEPATMETAVSIDQKAQSELKPAPAPAPVQTPMLQSSQRPGLRKSDEKRIAKAEKRAQSRKHKKWQQKHGLAGLPSKEELGYDENSMEIVEVAK